MSAPASDVRWSAARPGMRLPVATLQRASLWLLVAAGAVVIVEPAPYEIAFVLAGAVFMLTGLRLNRRLTPLILLLAAFNLGGGLSLLPYLGEQASVMFVTVSVYLMVTAVFFAAIMDKDAAARLDTIRSALVASAWVAGLAGLLGYFNVAGLGAVFSLYERAAGTFKDPNVLGSYLVLPIVCLVHSVLAGRLGALRGAALVSVPLLALFLTFSRGAWAHFVASVALLLLLVFLTSTSAARRRRILVAAALGMAGVLAGLMLILAVDEIAQTFRERAALVHDYDSGVTGRFGNQLRSIPMLLDLPNGFGPLRFRTFMREDPHNVYLNAFASYGWMGGIAYAALIVTTWVVGWRAVFLRTPLQPHLIALWSTFFVTTVQGLQIDTDHWRHFYLMLGLVWGIATVSRREQPAPPDREAERA